MQCCGVGSIRLVYAYADGNLPKALCRTWYGARGRSVESTDESAAGADMNNAHNEIAADGGGKESCRW